LVISVVVRLSFSLRRLRRAGRLRALRPTSVHCVHYDHGRDVAGAHTGHMAASTTRALTSRPVAACRVCVNEWGQNPRSFEPAKHGRKRRPNRGQPRGLYFSSLIDARIAAPESCVTKDRRIEHGDLELPPATLRAGPEASPPQVDLSHVDHQSPPIGRPLQHGEADRRLRTFSGRIAAAGQSPVRPERQVVQKIIVPGDMAELWRPY
jgi:hypothetical protein